MNVSSMKNIVVLKDLPSNLVDEAIVILKKGAKIKNKEIVDNVDNKTKNNFVEYDSNNYDIAIKEAEGIVKEYIDRIEKNNENKSYISKINLKYKRLKFCSLFLGITMIVRYNVVFI